MLCLVGPWFGNKLYCILFYKERERERERETDRQTDRQRYEGAYGRTPHILQLFHCSLSLSLSLSQHVCHIYIDRHLWPLLKEQGGISIVPDLLWHEASVFVDSSEGPPPFTRKGCWGHIFLSKFPRNIHKNMHMHPIYLKCACKINA